MNTNAKWIKAVENIGEMCPDFRRAFTAKGKIIKAEACVTALGIYNMYINGKRVGDYVFAPGYTSYDARVQYQKYDITEYLAENNDISVKVGKGWRYSALGTPPRPAVDCSGIAILASFEITYENGEVETLVTDETWDVYSSTVLYSEHYNGDVIDLTAEPQKLGAAILDTDEKPEVVLQVGEFIAERESFPLRAYNHSQGREGYRLRSEPCGIC